MKIVTNFCKPAGQMAPYVAGVLLLLSSTSVMMLVALCLSAFHVSGELPVLESQLAHYRSREVQKPADILSYDQLVALRSRVRELNELTHTTSQTLPSLLLQLEEHIPDGVWLVNLQYRSRENGAKLVAEANQASQLTAFMERLESSGNFSQVLLTRQAQRSEGAQHAIQFEIQLRGK
jgi:Tfp pilus assembly protein PilN